MVGERLKITEASAAERVALDINTSDTYWAAEMANFAKESGAMIVKFGRVILGKMGPAWCAGIARDNELEWVADAKLFDTKDTMVPAFRDIIENEAGYPPFGVTAHTLSLKDSMTALQIEADNFQKESGKEVMTIGVTVLTSQDTERLPTVLGLARRQLVERLSYEAVASGFKGITLGASEVRERRKDRITQDMFIMVPGSRSLGAIRHGQADDTGTPFEAAKYRASLIIAGRQVTEAQDMKGAYQSFVDEVQLGLIEQPDSNN